MPGPPPLIFVAKSLGKEEVEGKRVLEVGSKDKARYVRRLVTAWRPSSYVGIDMTPGEGVDEVCKAEDIVQRFGRRSFDVVISTETLEHVKDWKAAIQSIKSVCRPNGVIVITTRSPSFPFHSFPADYWRFEQADMQNILSDCSIESIEQDFERPGIFVKARIPSDFSQNDLSDYSLYSVILGRRVSKLAGEDASFSYRIKVARSKLRDAIYELGHWVIERI